MECVIFIGLPGSGKSSFYKERSFSTHVRISRDLLKTRFRELRMVETCVATGQRFVVDNTNPTKADRLKYITAAKNAGYKVIGYFFQSSVAECISRNAVRSEADRVPVVAIYATAKKLEAPELDEGFDQLFRIRLEEGHFVEEETSPTDG